jgi:UDP-N-acetylglucosamine--N-acetylmuramyl-(pentapeptide) pyrophosphoryl-undecaprenol N-acetylglucosamine transferase
LMPPLRVLFFANNGLGAGHLARTLAVARALRRRVKRLELLVATTSQADALLAIEPIATVRWPGPSLARANGWPEPVRRAVSARVMSGVIEGFRPELLVTDTFPSGPHGELGGLVREVPRRVLVRRTVRQGSTSDEAPGAGLADYELAIVPDDPDAVGSELLPIPSLRVPPVTLFEAGEGLARDAARARLGLAPGGRMVLVSAGGGGDGDAVAHAERIATAIAKVPGAPTPVLAVGPLGRARPLPSGVAQIEETPLQVCLAAFDGAFAAAGYNLAHELAKAGVPAALFPMARPYDDQAARAARFERAGLARALTSTDDTDVRSALAWLERAPRPSLPPGGAEHAADALLDLIAKGAS